MTITSEPPDADASFERRRRLARRTGALACFGIVASLVGIVLLVRPLATPVQDCGTAASFLLRGGANVYVDPANPPKGVTEAEAKANNDEPCQERAANRALPAGLLVLAGAVIATVTLCTEWVLRVRWHRADIGPRATAAATGSEVGTRTEVGIDVGTEAAAGPATEAPAG